MRGMGNMGNMMKQMQKMQKDMEQEQKALEVTEFTAEDTNGLVKVVLNGKREVKELTINEALVDPEDVEMLQDLVLATVNEGLKTVEKATEERMGRFTQGLNLPF